MGAGCRRSQHARAPRRLLLLRLLQRRRCPSGPSWTTRTSSPPAWASSPSQRWATAARAAWSAPSAAGRNGTGAAKRAVGCGWAGCLSCIEAAAARLHPDAAAARCRDASSRTPGRCTCCACRGRDLGHARQQHCMLRGRLATAAADKLRPACFLPPPSPLHTPRRGQAQGRGLLLPVHHRHLRGRPAPAGGGRLPHLRQGHHRPGGGRGPQGAEDGHAWPQRVAPLLPLRQKYSKGRRKRRGGSPLLAARCWPPAAGRPLLAARCWLSSLGGMLSVLTHLLPQGAAQRLLVECCKDSLLSIPACTRAPALLLACLSSCGCRLSCGGAKWPCAPAALADAGKEESSEEECSASAAEQPKQPNKASSGASAAKQPKKARK
jgi:hypothetical protein